MPSILLAACRRAITSFALLAAGDGALAAGLLDMGQEIAERDCGPVSAMYFAAAYGKDITLDRMRELCSTNDQGTSFLDLKSGLERLGLRPVALRMTPDQLLGLKDPSIIYLERPDAEIGHFVTLWPHNGKTLVLDTLWTPEVFDPMNFRYWNGIALINDPRAQPHENRARFWLCSAIVASAGFAFVQVGIRLKRRSSNP